MENVPSELNNNNLEQCLAEDSTLVDYFNTFLSLPCFPQRIFYNKELDLLEQFSQKLVKDENNNVQISSRPMQMPHKTKRGSSYKTVQISYCVTVLDKKIGFEWLKKYRLPEFLKSKLYAEYKLSKVLSATQATYIERVRDDIKKAKESHDENRRALSKTTEASLINKFQRKIKKNLEVNLERQDSSDTDSLQSDILDEIRLRNTGTNITNSNAGVDKSILSYINNNNKAETVQHVHGKNYEKMNNKVSITRKNGETGAEETRQYSEIDSEMAKISSETTGMNSRTIGINSKTTGIDKEMFGIDSETLGVASESVGIHSETAGINSETVGINATDTGTTASVIKTADENNLPKSSHFSATGGSDVMNTGDDVLRSDVTFSDVIESDVESSNGMSTVSDPFTDTGRPSAEICLNMNETYSSGIRMSPSYSEASLCTENCKVGELKRRVGNVDDGITGKADEACQRCKMKELSPENNEKGSSLGEATIARTKMVIFSRKETSDDISGEVLPKRNEGKQSETNSLNQEPSIDNSTLPITANENEIVRGRMVVSSLAETNSDLCGELSPKGSERGQNEAKSLHRERSVDKSTVPDTGLFDGEIENTKVSSVDSGTDKTRVESDIRNNENCRENKHTGQNSHVRLGSNSKNSKEEISSDVNKFQLGESSFKADKESFNLDEGDVTDKDSEMSFDESSSRNGVASRNSTTGDGNGLRDEEELPVDLSSKAGMDKLKGFLMNTKGESLLLFWLEVELWKHQENGKEKTKIIQDMKDTFLRNGSPLELPDETKRRIKMVVNDLSETQRIIAQPLHTYWCPRFTVHQLRACAFGIKKSPKLLDQCSSTLPLPRHTTTRRAWPDIVPAQNNELRVPSVSKSKSQAVRPQSCTPPKTCERETKCHLRSKSAHPRIITTPYHTNAGEKQLELYATPPPMQYGFQKRPMESFPPPNDQEYISPVRLVINPLPKPAARTAWPVESQNVAQSNQKYPTNVENPVFQESLAEALTYNSDTGSFLKEYIDKHNNKLWQNCLSLWQAVMEYSSYFESDVLNLVLVNQKAQWIYAKYIPTGSECDVQLARCKQAEIKHNLDPAYEDAFDAVEEHVLVCLKEPWDRLCRNERQEYDMVPKKETLRYLEVNLKERKKSGKRLVEESEGEDQSQREQGRYGIEEANHPISVPADGVTFETIIKDRDALEGLQKFLEKKDPKGVKDLMAWTDMETYQRIPKPMEDKRNKKARDIRQAYLNSRYFFGPDSPATKEAQNLILSMNGSSRISDVPSTSLISECQKYVRCRIEHRWLALYKDSQEYKERQNPKHHISEAVEDIMLRRRLQRSEAAWRVLNSRWVSSSRDIVALRQTLNNPESCLAFRKFVALKGDTYENDVLFWIEVQKYKDLCHRHASEKCIKKKIHAVTECFITSSIPPELQIDVPIEMAEKLMERITSRNQNIGPYLFREVQMTVFRVLFNMWKEFCTFRSTVQDENLVDVLEKKLRHHRLEVRLKRESNERRKLAKQEAEKKKKEKEEKERKDLKSMEQLVSLMSSEPSLWDREDEDVVLWRYSKHIMATERSERKRSFLAETSSLPAYTNQPSMVTKTSYNITNSMENERKDRLVSKSTTLPKSHGSLLTNSLYSNESGRSKKTKKSKNLLVPRIPHTGNTSKSEIQEDRLPGNETTSLSRQKKLRKAQKSTLLKNRRQKDAKKDCKEIPLPDVKDSGVEDAVGSSNTPGEKSPTKTEPAKRGAVTGKTCQSDALSVRSKSAGRLRTSVLRQQWMESHDRNTSPTPLTSELLEDFTNSPEGAPLDIPLPLIRISESQSINAEQSLAKQTKLKAQRGWDRLGPGYRRDQRTILTFVPDVIVN